MGCKESQVFNRPRMERKDAKTLEEYYGETETDMVPYGMTQYNNKVTNYNYLGYRISKEITGFGEIEYKHQSFEAWGMFYAGQPYGLCKVVYNQDIVYQGLMRELPHGKGKLQYSTLFRQGQYKGFFTKGIKDYVGEENTLDWYYVGQFTTDCRGPFGKYKFKKENTLFTYYGSYRDNEPDGEGMLKIKCYDSEPKLKKVEGDKRPNVVSRVDCVGEFRRGTQVSGTRKESRKIAEVDVTTREQAEFPVLEEKNARRERLVDKYKDLLVDMYNYDFEEFSDYKVNILADKISTVRLQLLRADFDPIFVKERLCGTLEDVAYSLHESYMLKMLEASVLQRQRVVGRTIQVPRVFPIVQRLPEGVDSHPLFNIGPERPRKGKVECKDIGRYHSLLCTTYMEYLDEEELIDKLVKHYEIPLSTISHLFFKAIDSFKMLESFGVVKGQIKLSSMYARQINGDIVVVFVGFNYARFMSGERMANKWRMLETLTNYARDNVNHQIPQQNYNDHTVANPIDYVHPGEFKNKKTAYLPTHIKKQWFSSDWRERMIEEDQVWLSLYSLAVSFLKAFCINLSFADRSAASYRQAYFYKKFEEFKGASDLSDSLVSFDKAMENSNIILHKLFVDLEEKVGRDKLALAAVEEVKKILVGTTRTAFSITAPANQEYNRSNTIRALNAKKERDVMIESIATDSVIMPMKVIGLRKKEKEDSKVFLISQSSVVPMLPAPSVIQQDLSGIDEAENENSHIMSGRGSGAVDPSQIEAMVKMEDEGISSKVGFDRNKRAIFDVQVSSIVPEKPRAGESGRSVEESKAMSSIPYNVDYVAAGFPSEHQHAEFVEETKHVDEVEREDAEESRTGAVDRADLMYAVDPVTVVDAVPQVDQVMERRWRVELPHREDAESIPAKGSRESPGESPGENQGENPGASVNRLSEARMETPARESSLVAEQKVMESIVVGTEVLKGSPSINSNEGAADLSHAPSMGSCLREQSYVPPAQPFSSSSYVPIMPKRRAKPTSKVITS